MKKVIVSLMALCAISFTACNHKLSTPAEEAVENSIYASSDDVMECYAAKQQCYRVNGTTIVSKCIVSVSCDGVEFANTYRFVWWNQHGCCWQVAKNLREVAEWQKDEESRETALREWADTL